MRKNTNGDPFSESYSHFNERDIISPRDQKCETDGVLYEGGPLFPKETAKRIDQFLIEISGVSSVEGSDVISQIDTNELEKLSEYQSQDSCEANSKNLYSEPFVTRYQGRISFLSEIQDVNESAEVSTVRRSSRRGFQWLSEEDENIEEDGFQGSINLPQSFSTHSFFEFFGFLRNFKVQLSRNHLVSAVCSLKKTRNNIKSPLKALKSMHSLVSESQDDKDEEEKRSDQTTKPSLIEGGKSRQVVELQNGTILTVERDSSSGQKMILLNSGSQNQSQEASSSCSNSMINDWSEFLRLLAKMASEALTLYYSENLLRRLSGNDCQKSTGTGGPKALFSLMQQNLTRVTNYEQSEITDLLWLNLDIFEGLVQRQTKVGISLLEEAIQFLTNKEKKSVNPRLVPLIQIILNDMEVTMQLLGVYVQRFISLRKDHSNYLFILQIFTNHFHSIIGSEKKAKKAAQDLIFKPTMSKKFLEVLYFNLQLYFYTRRRLILLRQICNNQRKDLIHFLTKHYENEEKLLRAVDIYLKKREKPSDWLFQ